MNTQIFASLIHVGKLLVWEVGGYIIYSMETFLDKLETEKVKF